MRVVVTGGAGYVGVALVRALVRRHDVDELVVYDNLSRRHFELFLDGTVDSGGRVSFVEGDILDGRSLDRVIDGTDALFHLAARVTTPYSDLDAHAVDQVNNWGAAQVARCAEKCDSLRRLVYLSSAAVYGSNGGPFSLSTPPEPASMYGLSKLRGERHFQRLEDDRVVHIVRSANVFGFGPAMRFDAVVNRMAFEARFRRRVTVHGSGEQTRSFIAVDRLAAVLAALLDEETAGLAIAADYNRSVADLVGDLRAFVPELEVLFVDQDARMRRNEAELPTSLMERLGPPVGFADALGDLLGHFSL